MEETVKERLMLFIKEKGLSQKRFEETAHISNGYVNNLKASPSSKVLQKIFYAFPDLSQSWLLTGVGPMLQSNNIPADRPRMSYTEGKPYYNVDFTGGFDIVLNDQTAKPDYLIDFKKYREADCWCNITGHSMEPLISNGDIIAIKELKNWRDFILYGEAYGIVTEDMRTVKIVTKSEKGDGYLHLVPVNKSVEYQPQDIPIKLITHVFKILGCMKKL